MRLLLLVSLLFTMYFGSTVYAQESIFDRLNRKSWGEGAVTVYQDSRLIDLVGKARAFALENGEQKEQRISGFRVQVYAGNNSQRARSEAEREAGKIKDLFPDFQIYTRFIAPRWTCRVGDYRTIEEADAVMRQLKATGLFKEVSIVRSLIIL